MTREAADALYTRQQTEWVDIHMRELRKSLEHLNICLGKVVLDDERLEELRRDSEALEALLAFSVAAAVQHPAGEVA